MDQETPELKLCTLNRLNLKPQHCAAKGYPHWCSSGPGAASRHRELGWCLALGVVLGTWGTSVVVYPKSYKRQKRQGKWYLASLSKAKVTFCSPSITLYKHLIINAIDESVQMIFVLDVHCTELTSSIYTHRLPTADS